MIDLPNVAGRSPIQQRPGPQCHTGPIEGPAWAAVDVAGRRLSGANRPIDQVGQFGQ